MRTRAVALIVGTVMTVFGMMPNMANAAPSSDVWSISFVGTTSISSQCEYEWENPTAATIERDDVNIPRAKLYPDGPHCRDTNASVPGIQAKSCSLARNTAAYPPPQRENNPDLTKGEVGLYPPCMGRLAASEIPGEVGCNAVGNTSTGPVRGTCDIQTPGWFYGYCGQTYGGGNGGTIKTPDGKTWRIDRFGFARGRGTWEVSGKLTLLNGAGQPTSTTHTYRNSANAVPNNPNQAAACDVGQGLTSVAFAGTLVMPAPPVKVIRTKPGWHWCTADPVIGETISGTSGDGC